MQEDQRFQEILEQHNKQQQKMLQDVALTQENIKRVEERLKKITSIKIPKDASLTELLELSDMLDTL